VTVVEDTLIRFGAEYPLPVVLAKTYPHSSRTVSLRLLSFLL